MGNWAHIVWTVLLLLAFVGIVVWAWSGRRQRRFEQAARLPLEDERPPRERTHG
jgi:cytochrome c oxidase cbb3-type subunit 4